MKVGQRSWSREMNAKSLGEPTPPATPQPKCAHCGEPASCLGSYDGAPEAYACDACCGHGNEDGKCVPLDGVSPATPQPGTKACGHRGPCECAHYIDPTRRALSPPPDVERLQQRWDTRDAALRALVEQLGTIWNDERNCNAARADMALWCRNELSRLLGHEP